MERYFIVTEWKTESKKMPSLKIKKVKIPIKYRIGDLVKGPGAWVYETKKQDEANTVCQELNRLNKDSVEQKVMRN